MGQYTKEGATKMAKLTDVYGGVKPTVSQMQPHPEKPEQVKNSAGGYVFQLEDFSRLERFLILGSDSNTYYVSSTKLTRDNAKCVERCIAQDGERTVKTITDISVAGRAPKNDQALFALAQCVAFGNLPTRGHALAQLPKVARTGTHLFQFLEYLKGMRSNQAEGAPKMRWNRSIRNGVADWYLQKEAQNLAYQMVKYQSRRVDGTVGWSHRDILRTTHAGSHHHLSTGHKALFDWATKGLHGADVEKDLPELVKQFEALKNEKDAKVIIAAIEKYNLTREMIPTEALNDVKVWDALLQKMPLTALIRNLGKMSQIKLLTTFSDATKLVVSKLSDQEYLRKSRVHPMHVLAALLTYKHGRGVRGSLTWDVVGPVVDTLDKAFYATFANADTTNLNYYIGVDCSGSMGGGILANVPGLTPIVGAAAMAMVIMNNEPFHHVAGYASGSGGWRSSGSMTHIGLTKNMRLDNAVERAMAVNWGGTDCSLPYKDATVKGMPIDVFINITDNETWAGTQHVFKALEEYRQKSGRNAYQIVIGMTANGFTIADPSDLRSLDVVGFDTNVPSMISKFVTGDQTGLQETEEPEVE
jgi:60 kDa SS-A/Ro ribonucleoprotein